MARLILICVLGGLCIVSCNSDRRHVALTSEDSIRIVHDNSLHRHETERFFAEDPSSPFKNDTTIEYQGLQWYPIDPRFTVRSVLHRYESPETVVVLGTKGEERRQLKYGYFSFRLPRSDGSMHDLRLNVYKFTPYDERRYKLYKNHLSVWFTDKTTGTETYEVGRYVELGEENADPDFEYVIDFNKAYNPYCAYSALYSCAIPTDEDHLDVYVTAGEKAYH